MFETIVALATPPLKSALAIVRLSGDNCFFVVNNFFSKDLTKYTKNTIIHGQIIDNNELVKLAVSNKFKKKYRILLDVHDYKNKKYNVLIRVAKNAAREVLKTHMDVKLNPMTPDERKKVHYALSTMKNIKTESVGDGKDRAIVIKYVKEETAQANVEPKEE